MSYGYSNLSHACKQREAIAITGVSEPIDYVTDPERPPFVTVVIESARDDMYMISKLMQ